jgi:putative membrane protein
MRRQHSRFVTAAIGGFAAVQLAGACAAVDGRRGGADGTQLLTVAVKAAGPMTTESGFAQTKWGPLSAADRDLLVKVRQAGLWEIPVGREAAERAVRAKTREMLGGMAEQHVVLDRDVRRVAERLRVPLPDQPSEAQQGFLAEISGKSGLDYDRTAVLRLRQAHGGVFPVIAQVRATTQNQHIRDFAERAAAFVNGHMDMLEATGLVDASAIPPAPVVNSAPAPVPSGSPAPSAPPATSVISTND